MAESSHLEPGASGGYVASQPDPHRDVAKHFTRHTSPDIFPVIEKKLDQVWRPEIHKGAQAPLP